MKYCQLVLTTLSPFKATKVKYQKDGVADSDAQHYCQFTASHKLHST